jgi:CBS domain-containing protein
VVDIEEHHTVYDAIKLMADRQVGSILVKAPHLNMVIN